MKIPSHHFIPTSGNIPHHGAAPTKSKPFQYHSLDGKLLAQKYTAWSKKSENVEELLRYFNCSCIARIRHNEH